MLNLILGAVALYALIRLVPALFLIIRGLSDNAKKSIAVRNKQLDIRQKHQAVIEQMDQELNVLSHSFKCPSCGATLTMNAQHISSFCQFCGAALPKAEELIKLGYEFNEKKEQRNLEIERMKHEERKLKESNYHNRTQRIVLLFACVAMLGVLLLFWRILK